MAMRDLAYFESCLRDLKSFAAFDRVSHKPQRLPNGVHKLTYKNKRQHLARRRRFNPLIDLNETKFRLKYRFSKENLRRIIEIVRDDLEIDHNQQTKNKQVPVDLQIMAALRFWGGSEHPEITAMVHGISFRTLNKICRRVASALASKASRYIRMPATLSEKEMVLRSFQDLANMPQVIGAVVYGSVKHQTKQMQYEEHLGVSTSDPEDYIHLQIVCDATHKIHDLDLRHSDEINSISEIFMQSRIKERFEQNEFRGRLLLGSEPLTCTHFLFTPVKCPKRESEDLYNRMHKATYAPAINCISLWRRRFGVLGNVICSSFGSAKQTITALALLHNMAVEWNDKSLGLDNNGINENESVLMNLFEYTMDQPSGDERTRRDFIRSNF